MSNTLHFSDMWLFEEIFRFLQIKFRHFTKGGKGTENCAVDCALGWVLFPLYTTIGFSFKGFLSLKSWTVNQSITCYTGAFSILCSSALLSQLLSAAGLHFLCVTVSRSTSPQSPPSFSVPPSTEKWGILSCLSAAVYFSIHLNPLCLCMTLLSQSASTAALTTGVCVYGEAREALSGSSRSMAFDLF